ncbi:hypothetical protein TCAL_01639 [Tigriopus californicus]|uniref:MAGUK p55 subfamily member 6 n=1 Tax=Tigriopus californicus TaxID=6832 RepID=A0A553PCG4_TIGCA|nr:MAGUK p55 subfamily member 2-like [Tigriopus californicus]XP_059098779.1 MAGUK p55 subfamily member 2-like [Tigriopus californicus]TRY75350.1 hypothetical protein TCAL_01639 [Tigriopus californicus]
MDNGVMEEREYFDEVHRISVPKPLEGEKLGLTVQQRDGCVVVTRILSGGLLDSVGHVQLGDIILEVNNIPINSPEDLMALVSISDKSIHFLVKKTPEHELKKYGIPNTPKLRKQVQSKASLEQKVIMHVRALFDYDPYQDNLIPCPEAGLEFKFGDILGILNQDDPNWWQAIYADYPNEAAKLIPSQELEERRKAYVAPEADYTTKIGLCGSLVSRKKKKILFKSKQNSDYDKAELLLYEEMTLLQRPFRRKTLVLIGGNGVGRRTLKNRIVNSDLDQFASPLPHTSRPKREEEENGGRYWFVDREDMEYGIKNHEYLEYGELNGHLYGTRFDSIQAIMDQGKTCVFDPSPQSLKLLRTSSEFMPFVVFLAAPGYEEMKHTIDSKKVTHSLISASNTLANFERNSSIRNSSRRARTLDSISSLYVEEDVMKNLEESSRLERAYKAYFDMIVVNESHDETYRMVMEGLHSVSMGEQWVPSTWIYA